MRTADLNGSNALALVPTNCFKSTNSEAWRWLANSPTRLSVVLNMWLHEMYLT